MSQSLSDTPTPAKKQCPWCNAEQHLCVQCPAKSLTCNFCQKRGHFERACHLKTKNVPRHSLNAVNISEAGSSDNEYQHHMSVRNQAASMSTADSPAAQDHLLRSGHFQTSNSVKAGQLSQSFMALRQTNSRR